MIKIISINHVVGTFNNITIEEMEIKVPNASKIVFSVDSATLEISINDNQHYIEYMNSDGIIEFKNDSVNALNIDRVFVRVSSKRFLANSNMLGELRMWALT